MTTALRLPDPFTPGVTEAGAATPTCCCCCCCCAVSSVSAAIALPSALHNDLRDTATSTKVSSGLVILPAALFPLLVLVSPIVGGFDDWISGLLYAGFPAALLWAGFASWLVGAPRPWRGTVRLLVWAAAFCAEFFLALPLLAVLANLGPVVAGILYFGLVAVAGRLVFANYRRRRT